MKIIGLCASPRTGGNTRRLLNHFLKTCEHLGASTEVFSVCDHHVDFCVACEMCMRQGACPIQDDYTALLPNILAADALVLASPNYAFDMSAQIKAVFDRSHAFLFYAQALKGKYGIGICVAGHPAMTRSIAKRCGQAVWLCGGTYVGALTGISKHRDKKGFVDSDKVYKNAEKLAGRLIKAISRKKKNRLQDWIRDHFVVSHLRKTFTRRAQEYPFVAQELLKKKS